MSENNVKKPLPLRLVDAENELIEAVNLVMHNNNIPCYLIEPMFDKVNRYIKNEANKERAIAEREYQTQLMAEAKENENSNDDTKK